MDSTLHQLPVMAVVAWPEENTQFRFDGVVISHRMDKQHGGASFLLVQPEADISRLLSKINGNGDTPSLGPGRLTYFVEPFATFLL